MAGVTMEQHTGEYDLSLDFATRVKVVVTRSEEEVSKWLCEAIQYVPERFGDWFYVGIDIMLGETEDETKGAPIAVLAICVDYFKVLIFQINNCQEVPYEDLNRFFAHENIYIVGMDIEKKGDAILDEYNIHVLNLEGNEKIYHRQPVLFKWEDLRNVAETHKKDPNLMHSTLYQISEAISGWPIRYPQDPSMWENAFLDEDQILYAALQVSLLSYVRTQIAHQQNDAN